MNKNIIIMVVVAVIVGAGAFFAGVKYQQSKGSAFLRQGGFQGTRAGGDRTEGNAGFRPVSGEIIAADDESITIKLQDGSSKIVLFSDSTQINKAEGANKNDLKTGEQVAVFGTQNSDGSVTAQTIQLNPQQLRGAPDQNSN